MSTNQLPVIDEEPPPPLHILWQGIPFTLYECRLACALAIYVQFEDGTPLDHITIGKVISASSGLQNMNCAGLVDYLRLTNNVYPEVLVCSAGWARWARDAWNMWLDPMAAPDGTWP